MPIITQATFLNKDMGQQRFEFYSNKRIYRCFGDGPHPDDADYGLLRRLSEDLPPGMKLVPYSPDGVPENVIRLMDFNNPCFKRVR